MPLIFDRNCPILAGYQHFSNATMHASFRTMTARLASALAAAVLAAGCATTTTTIVSDPLKLTPSSELKPVALSVTANTSEIRGFDNMTVVRVSESQAKGEPGVTQNFVLRQVVPGMARDTALFIGSLPPGEYYFASFSDTKTNKILRIPAASKLLDHFVVGAAKPVDLGRIIVTPLNTNVVYGRSKKVTSNTALMQRFSPQHAALFAGDVERGWKSDPGGAAGDTVEAYAMGRPVGADCITELPDGSVLAASRLGTILRRTPAGRWGALHSEGLESLLCVIPSDLPDTELIAVGEFNTLLRKPRNAGKLVPVDTGDLPAGNLLRISGNAGTGWVVAQQRGSEITLYHSAQLEAGKWTALRKESVAPNFWSGGTAFWMWKTPAGFAYATSNGPFHFYDAAAHSWSEAPIPNNARIVNISESPNGELGLLTSPGGGFAGIFASAWYSKDQAKTWKTVDLPYKIKAFPVQFTADGAMLAAGGVMSDHELQISRDEGRTWTHHAAYALDRHFVALKNGDMIDANNGTYGLFSIRSSKDGGKTWDYEYSNFDKAAYDMKAAAKAK